MSARRQMTGPVKTIFALTIFLGVGSCAAGQGNGGRAATTPVNTTSASTTSANGSSAKVDAPGSMAAAVAADPVLKAMREELERSKSQLKMERVAAPYYIEYRISDVEEWDLEAAFGALRQDQKIHGRTARDRRAHI